jgi:hypothetical protein
MSAEHAAEGFEALTDAEPAYSLAHRYYSGEAPEVFASRTLARLVRKTGDKFKMNVIKAVPDAVADRLEVLSMTVQPAAGEQPVNTPSGASISSPAQARLDRIIEANGLDSEVPKWLHRAAEYGDAFVIVWEGEEDNDEPVVNYVDPSRLRIVYDTDNPRVKKYAVHSWKVKNPLGDAAERWRVNLLYSDRIERWETKPGTKPEDPAAWVESLAEDDDPDSWVEENPYGEVPVFHLRNDTPYGYPEHLNGYGAQDAVNKIVIAHMTTVDFHLAPQRYALVENDDDEDADEFDIGDEFDETDEAESVEEREARKGIRSGAGELWWLKGVKSVGQFDPANSETFTKPATFYLGLMAQMTTTPFHILDESGDEPSGESRRRKEGPLVKKVRDRMKMYAPEMGRLLAFALRVAGLDGRTVEVKFAPPEVVSDAEGWATIKAKIEAGVPVRTALLEAGYTTDQVNEWFPEGEENSFRVADLLAVSDVLQKLGAAVAMNIITAEEARALLPEGVFPEGAPAPAAPPAPASPPSPEE